ncbi:MAG: GMC family oxidoreductase N-terminal domain-containing protein [Candidatus Latescibacterota bacterium]
MRMKLESYDVVVVGSGFGGALAAHALTRAGRRVLLLERGRWAHRDALDWDQREILLNQRYRGQTPLLVKQYGARRFSEVFANETVGGKSIFYGGASLRLREADFLRWPFSYADLKEYYARAEVLLGVHGTAGADPYEPPDLQAYPFAPVELSAPAQRIQDAGNELGYRPFPIPLAINFRGGERPRCLLCNTCDGFPCKVEAKNDLAVTLLQQAQQEGLEIIAGASVQRLVVEAGAVRAVEYADVNTGASYAVNATQVVLAAGAVQSPALLLRSGLEHPLIGRFLMRHCNAACSYVFPYRTNPDQVFHKQLCFADFYEDLRAELGTAVGVIQDIYTPGPEILRHHAPRGGRWVAGLFAPLMQNLLCIAEDEPQANNRVQLGARKDVWGAPLAEVVHEYSRADYRRRDYLLKRARRVLRKAGGLASYTYAIDSFSHAVGTLRCAETAEAGVLDRDCRVWETDNLFVTDGSFMPSSGGVNPSLTIAANALRVAERMLAG